MKSLSDFYSKQDQLIKRLDESKESMTMSPPLYEKAEVTEPIILSDDVSFDLYRFITLTNSHFIPNRKPGIGLCTGDYLKHDNKDYITGILGVAYSNSFVLHIARNYEQTMEEWVKIQNETIEIFKKVSDFAEENSPEIFIKLKLDENYYKDHVGWSSIPTPSKEYMNKFKELIDEYTRLKKYPEIIEICQKLINDCQKFTSLGEKFDEIRSLSGAKSVPSFREDKITLNSPSASGGSSWFQLSSSEIIDAVPNENNLFFYAAHSNKLSHNIVGIGGGKSVDKSITFIVPSGLLQKIQEVVDKYSDLVQSWEEYKFNPMDTVEVSWKKSSEWKNLVNEKIKIEVIEIIKESINEEVIGIQCDISKSPKSCYLRPVITETYARKNIDLMNEKGFLNMTSLYEKFLMDGSDGYYVMD